MRERRSSNEVRSSYIKVTVDEPVNPYLNNNLWSLKLLRRKRSYRANTSSSNFSKNLAEFLRSSREKLKRMYINCFVSLS